MKQGQTRWSCFCCFHRLVDIMYDSVTVLLISRIRDVNVIGCGPSVGHRRSRRISLSLQNKIFWVKQHIWWLTVTLVEKHCRISSWLSFRLSSARRGEGWPPEDSVWWQLHCMALYGTVYWNFVNSRSYSVEDVARAEGTQFALPRNPAIRGLGRISPREKEGSESQAVVESQGEIERLRMFD